MNVWTADSGGSGMIGNDNPRNSMPKRISKLTKSLKELGDLQVNDWDFMTLLHKDVSQLELSRSLRRLGNVQVMQWDFRTVLPAVNKLANKEVDLVDLFKRTAHYKVLEWDFRNTPPAKDRGARQGAAGPLPKRLSDAEMQALIMRLKNFLQYVVVNLIDEPGHARIIVCEIQNHVLRFKLVLLKRDMAMLIGREGHTASAIRSILKASAATQGVNVLLEILAHGEDAG